MSKFLLILAIILAGGAAYLGYQTKLRIVDLQLVRDNALKDASTTHATLKKTQEDLKSTQEQLATSKDEAAKLSADLTTAKSDIDKITAEKAELQAKYDEVQKALDDVKNKFHAEGGPSGDADSLAKTINDLQAKLKDTEIKYGEAQQLTATLQAKVSDLEGKNQVLTQYKTHHEGTVMARGLEGQVMAVNQGWNFVVISLGDRQGALPNAQMLVKRGDTLVAKVTISSVEPSTSIADIVPGSVPRGQRVMPGDRVVYPGP
jgi:predicted RNase H-like nuclease (RuvC/YqgF family)